MLEMIVETAAGLGWPDEAIHFEYFQNDKVIDSSSAFDVELARSAMTLHVPPGKTILEIMREAGLTGVEVDHQDHDDAARASLRAIAADLGLVVTGSSDHHGTGKVDHDLGCNLTAPEEYERLVAARP